MHLVWGILEGDISSVIINLLSLQLRPGSDVFTHISCLCCHYRIFMSPNLAASGVAAHPIAAVSHPLPAGERPSCTWDGRPASAHPAQASPTRCLCKPWSCYSLSCSPLQPKREIRKPWSLQIGAVFDFWCAQRGLIFWIQCIGTWAMEGRCGVRSYLNGQQWSCHLLEMPSAFQKRHSFQTERMQSSMLWTEVKSIQESIKIHSLISYPYC